MVQAIEDNSAISQPVKKQETLLHALSDKEFAVNLPDLGELVLKEEILDQKELMELIDAPTSNALVNENKENELVPNLDLQDLKTGANQNFFIQTNR